LQHLTDRQMQHKRGATRPQRHCVPQGLLGMSPRLASACGPLQRRCGHVRAWRQWRGWSHAHTHRAPLGPRLTGALHRVVFMHVHDLLGAARTVALRGNSSRKKLCGFMHLAYAHAAYRHQTQRCSWRGWRSKREWLRSRRGCSAQ